MSKPKISPEEKKARKTAYKKSWRAANREKDNIVNAAWKKANPDKVKIMGKAWREANKEKRKEYMNSWWKNNKDKNKVYRTVHKNRNENHRLKRKYGITLEDRQKMFDEQQGKCKGCGINESELNKPLHIDHNHTTGKVRCLLCGSCNRALGLVKDNIVTLENLKKIIENE